MINTVAASAPAAPLSNGRKRHLALARKTTKAVHDHMSQIGKKGYAALVAKLSKQNVEHGEQEEQAPRML